MGLIGAFVDLAKDSKGTIKTEYHGQTNTGYN